MLSTTAASINTAELCLKNVTTEISSMLEHGTLCPIDSKAYFHILELIAQANQAVK